MPGRNLAGRGRGASSRLISCPLFRYGCLLDLYEGMDQEQHAEWLGERIITEVASDLG